MRRLMLLVLVGVACRPLPPAAAEDFQPDPRSVQRRGPAYRYPQAGWVVLHIEGEPYERGVQHGRLMAPEIAAHIRCFATVRSPRAPADGWRLTRELVNALFLRRYDKEYLEEMKGIADGASAAGARFDNRPVDLLDIVCLNAWSEVGTLGSALNATPTGLEALRFPEEKARPRPAPQPMHCSAFAATGPATRDGKIVFGHITMFSLYPASFYNVWLDVKPARGHRVFMQTFPGGIQSGLDYYFNDAGLLVCETTLAQTRFDITGTALASRIRQALQYADTIDRAVEVLRVGNNGLYTNEWLLADTKTNEIALFELGTHKSKLYRSGKNEWFGGTEGFYWGCNNAKDLEVRLETVASVAGRPASAVFRPADRDLKWLELYDRYKGKIDVEFGKVAFTTPPVAAYRSLDAKFTTTDLARELKTWALFGPPLGRTWQPTFEERQRYPEVRPLVSNPWTVLHARPPERTRPQGPAVVDVGKVPEPVAARDDQRAGRRRPDLPPTVPAWHGTVLPRTDADLWLATAFAQYEKVVALENYLRERSGGKLTPADRDQVALALFACRADYELGARAHPERPLSGTRPDLRNNDWFRVASGKGVLLLHELRGLMGAEAFDKMMDQFGRENAGKPVTAEQFQACARKASGKDLGAFFDGWLNKPGLPPPISREKVSAPPRQAGPFSVLTPHAELEQALIVYGTADEVPTNREAATALRRALIERGPNITVPVKADREVTDEDLKDRHLLLIGRPDSNTVVQRFRSSLPLTFGSHSFVVRDKAYAHPDSAVIAAAENPLNRRYALVVIAGLDAASTLRAAPQLGSRLQRQAEVVVLPHGAQPLPLVASTK